MKPIRTPDTSAVFTLPGGTEENNLPITQGEDGKGSPVLISTWELTEEERQRISEGENIELIVWGMGHPPVAVTVVNGGNTSETHD